MLIIKTVPVIALRCFCLLSFPLPKKCPVRVYDSVARTTKLLFDIKCRVNILKLAETFLLNASWSQIRQAHRNTLQIRSRNFPTNSFAMDSTRLKNPKRVFQSLTFTAEDCNVTSTRRKDAWIN